MIVLPFMYQKVKKYFWLSITNYRCRVIKYSCPKKLVEIFFGHYSTIQMCKVQLSVQDFLYYDYFFGTKKKSKVFLNENKTDPNFLQFFIINTTLYLIIHVFCQSCAPEIVFVLTFALEIWKKISICLIFTLLSRMHC